MAKENETSELANTVKRMQYPEYIKDREEKFKRKLYVPPDSDWTKLRKNLARRLRDSAERK